MAMPPQAAMKAPSGARKPRTLTERGFELGGVAEGVATDEVAADDRRENSAGVDGHVGGRSRRCRGRWSDARRHPMRLRWRLR